MTHAEKVAEAARLKAQGLSPAEIAQRLGARRKSVYGWLNDPDGSKARARKRSYRGTCEECGGPTTGGDGPTKAPKICATCFATRNEARNQRVFVDWNRGVDGEEIAEREGISYRSVTAMVDYYRRRHGYALTPRRRSNRTLWPRIEELWSRGWSAAQITAELGITKSNLSQTATQMRRHGIALEYRDGWYDELTRARALRLYANGWGCTRVAKEIGVSYMTVWRWTEAAGITRKRQKRTAAA